MSRPRRSTSLCRPRSSSSCGSSSTSSMPASSSSPTIWAWWRTWPTASSSCAPARWSSRVLRRRSSTSRSTRTRSSSSRLCPTSAPGPTAKYSAAASTMSRPRCPTSALIRPRTPMTRSGSRTPVPAVTASPKQERPIWPWPRHEPRRPSRTFPISRWTPRRRTTIPVRRRTSRSPRPCSCVTPRSNIPRSDGRRPSVPLTTSIS